MSRQNLIHKTQRIVIKIGSSLITRDGKGLAQTEIADWAKQIAKLREQGKELVLVSSGAVAEGMARLEWKQRPQALHELQAAAAIGQMGLIQSYEACFKKFDLKTAQILLTHDDLENRRRYLNARSTLKTLLELGAVPIVNENDTVAMDEIRFGDNDSLASMVANLIEAHLLIILTDQKGLFTANPQLDASAQLIPEGDANDPELLSMAGPGASDIGRGGMTTKILAARRAAKSGTHTIICSGREPNILLDIFDPNQAEHGTFLKAGQGMLAARKRWLADNMQPKGALILDAGAVVKLTKSGSSLLAIGVTAAEGKFKRGDLVVCLDSNRNEIARGLVNYNQAETNSIKGQSSKKIQGILGYIDEPELIHRDNLVIS